MTDIDRLRERLRVSWVALLVAAGCDGPATDAKPVDAKVVTPETKVAVDAKPEDVAALEKARAEAARQTEAALAAAKAAEAEAAAAKAKADEEARLAAEAEAKKLGTKPGEPTLPDGPGMNMPSCPSGRWSGVAALAKKMQRKGSGSSNGCPKEIEREDQAFSKDEIKALFELPRNASGTLDITATKKAGAGACAYTWVIPCPGGRVLVGADGLVLAEVCEDGAWVTGGADGAVDAALAEAWLLDARTEHASVASFARATLELLAVGAPPALVSATQQASLDEVEHARLCFGLASRYAGKLVGPGPLTAVGAREASLVRLACDVFVEGCVGETIAALAATRARRRCEDGEVRDVLARIEEDETRHAALAWATLGWACERGGETVRAAVRALAESMRGEVLAVEAVPADARASWLARHGRLDAAGQQVCVRDAWEALIPAALADVVG